MVWFKIFWGQCKLYESERRKRQRHRSETERQKNNSDTSNILTHFIYISCFYYVFANTKQIMTYDILCFSFLGDSVGLTAVVCIPTAADMIPLPKGRVPFCGAEIAANIDMVYGLWNKIVYGTGCGLWMTMEHRLSHSLSNIDRSMDVYSPWNKTVYSHQPMCIQCILYHNMVLYVCYNLVRESEVMDVRNKKCSLKVAFEDHFWLQWSFGPSVSTGWE